VIRRLPAPVPVLALVLATSAEVASAHHSITTVYDSSRPVTVEGRVTEFLFVNPHPILIIEAAADESAPQSWRLEMDNRFELSEIGITADTFKPGDHVVATGSAGRTQPQSLYLRRLDRAADGFRYEQIGSRPRTNARQ
jgi:hypothetical protein